MCCVVDYQINVIVFTFSCMSVVQHCALKIDLDSVSCVMAFWRGHSVTCWHYCPSFFCRARRSSLLSSTLLQSRSTKDSWLLGEIQTAWWWLAKRAFGCLVSLAFPLCKSTVEMREGENVKVLTTAMMHFTAESRNGLCETSSRIPIQKSHEVCLFQLLYCLHHVPCLLPGVG